MQVEILDETHQRFNGKIYYRHESGYFRRNGLNKQYALHREVWKCHNGKIPKGYEIHHVDLDKSNNDISNLQLLTRAEHRRLHTALATHEIICEICGQTFTGISARLCPSCCQKRQSSKPSKSKRLDEFVKLMRAAARRIKSVSNRLRTCENCGKVYVLASNSHRKTCSEACAQAVMDQCHDSRRVDRTKICEVCGKTFQYKHKKNRTCSPACGNILGKRTLARS